MDLHGQIMNLCADNKPGIPLCGGSPEVREALAYKVGHRDARHAAAEMALKADACIEALRDLVELYSSRAAPQNRATGWLAAAEALAALDGPVLVVPNVELSGDSGTPEASDPMQG